jgi:hypothetical protein
MEQPEAETAAMRPRERIRRDHGAVTAPTPRPARDPAPNPASSRATHPRAEASRTQFAPPLVAKAAARNRFRVQGSTRSVSIQAPQCMAATRRNTPGANALIIASPVRGTTDVAGAPIPATTTNRPHHGVY